MILLAIETGMRAGEIIFIAAAMNQITACVTAKQIADIHYMTKKHLKVRHMSIIRSNLPHCSQ